MTLSEEEVVIYGQIFHVSEPSEALAIDDISFSEGCISTLADTCDFESGQCGWWIAETVEQANWSWVKAGGISVNESAPIQDHSLRSSEGHYMWVAANNDTFSQSVFLNSSKYHSSGPSCAFRFYYNIQGNNTLKLWLHTEKMAGDGTQLAEYCNGCVDLKLKNISLAWFHTCDVL
nr:PREDICTED: MAM and LDL-receptor class A domain-containing protein 1-like [Lepisosteus oculatus]